VKILLLSKVTVNLGSAVTVYCEGTHRRHHCWPELSYKRLRHYSPSSFPNGQLTFGFLSSAADYCVLLSSNVKVAGDMNLELFN